MSQEAVSTKAQRAFRMVMAPGQTCLDLTLLEKRLREAGVPFMGGENPTHEPTGDGAFAAPKKSDETPQKVRAVADLVDSQNGAVTNAGTFLRQLADEIEWWASEKLDLQHECREAAASEAAAINRARKVERQMLEIRKRLQGDDLAREVADALHVDGKYSAKPASFRAQREATIRPILSTAEILLTRDAASCVGDDS